jgi:hypothetical protein
MKMGRGALIILGVFGASCLVSIAAYFLKAPEFGKWVTAPALLLSGWACAGHLVTLDDDMRGGWSNPDGSRAVAYRSLGELFVKFVLFITALGLFSLHF